MHFLSFTVKLNIENMIILKNLQRNLDAMIADHEALEFDGFSSHTDTGRLPA